MKTITNAYDQGFCTLRQAVGCADAGDTIRLDLPAGDTLIVASDQLVIDKNLTIININAGQAPVYCDMNGVGISVASGYIVKLHDLSMGGSGTGILQNEGILHLHDVMLNPAGISGPVLVNENEARIYGVVEIMD